MVAPSEPFGLKNNNISLKDLVSLVLTSRLWLCFWQPSRTSWMLGSTYIALSDGDTAQQLVQLLWYVCVQFDMYTDPIIEFDCEQ